MKNLLLIGLFVFASSIACKAQGPGLRGSVKFNLIGLIGNQYQLAYEQSISPHSTIQLSAGLISRNWDYDLSNEVQYDRGFIIIPEYRWYLRNAGEGVYVAGFFRYRKTTHEWISNDTDERVYGDTQLSIGGGATIGYQIVISGLVAIDMFFGPQYKVATYTPDSGFETVRKPVSSGQEETTPGIRAGVIVGLGW